MTKEDLQKYLDFFNRRYDSYWMINNQFKRATNEKNRKRPKYEMEIEEQLVENYINENWDLRVLITGETDDDY